jgi:hypothetical protein
MELDRARGLDIARVERLNAVVAAELQQLVSFVQSQDIPNYI